MAWLRRLAIIAAIVFAAHLDLQTWNTLVDGLLDRADAAQPPTVVGSPVVLRRDGTLTVYLLTAREQRHRPRRWGLTRLSRASELQVHLWAFDAAAARPRWHRRVFAAPDAVASEIALLGIDGDTVWLYAHGLQARDAGTGDLLHDAAAITQRNPQLAGQLVADPHYYGFDAAGLYLTGADGRQWRIAAHDRLAVPVGSTPAAARTEAIVPRPWLAATQTAFLARSIELGEHWLGVLTDAEAARLSAPLPESGAQTGRAAAAAAAHMAAVRGVSGLPPLQAAQRYRLWRARIEHRSLAPPDWPEDFPDNWGTYRHYTAFVPLDAAPSFLGGGLLDPAGTRTSAWLRDPDSVFVLDRDRLGEDGRLRLARVAGPDGRVVWQSPLPLSLIQAVAVEDTQAVLFGREYRWPGGPATVGAGDPYHAASERLVGVDLRSGAVAAFGIAEDGGALLDAAREQER